MIRNTLHVPSMDHKMIPHFIMRFVSVTNNDVPKSHCEDPVINDHSISFNRCDLCIALQLNGVLSCFHTRVHAEIELN